MECKYLSDSFSEICVNADCPYCCDFCPVTQEPQVCRYFEESKGDGQNDRAGSRQELQGEASDGV